jgi:hypothetical protein
VRRSKIPFFVDWAVAKRHEELRQLLFDSKEWAVAQLLRLGELNKIACQLDVDTAVMVRVGLGDCCDCLSTHAAMYSSVSYRSCLCFSPHAQCPAWRWSVVRSSRVCRTRR